MTEQQTHRYQRYQEVRFPNSHDLLVDGQITDLWMENGVPWYEVTDLTDPCGNTREVPEEWIRT